MKGLAFAALIVVSLTASIGMSLAFAHWGDPEAVWFWGLVGVRP